MAQNDDIFYWYRIERIPKWHQDLFKKICDVLKDLLEDQWEHLHNYQNAMHSLLGSAYEKCKSEILSVISKEDDMYQYFLSKLECIDIKFKTQLFIPKNLIRFEFLRIAKLFFSPFYDYIEGTIEDIFKSEYEYGSVWSDRYHTTAVFTNVIDTSDVYYMNSEKYIKSAIDTNPLIF